MNTRGPMTPEERRTAIARLAELPRDLEAVVAGLNDAQLDTPYRPGGWTVRQVVHHLADAHLQGFVRMKFVLTERHPLLKPYGQDAWAATPDACGGPVAESLELLRGLHARWVRLLEGVGEEQWSRTAFHPERGDLTLGDLLRTYEGHGASHVAAVAALRKERQW